MLRQLIDATGRILYDAYTSREPVQNLLDGAEKEIFKIAESPGGADMATLEQLVHETYQKLEAQEGRHITGLASGFFDLDEMTAGLQPGELIILAARPSMGKTAFALNVAEHVGVSDRQCVAVFSLEMSRQQLAQRLLCSRSGVDAQRVQSQHASRGGLAPPASGHGRTFQRRSLSMTRPVSRCSASRQARRMAARYDIKLIVIDYLQLMKPRAANHASRKSPNCRAASRQWHRPFRSGLCLSQANRASEGREGHRPRMSGIRDRDPSSRMRTWCSCSTAKSTTT